MGSFFSRNQNPEGPNAMSNEELGTATLFDVTIERKTIANLLCDSGRGHQLKQTLTLRRADFRNTFILLEGVL